MKTPIIGIIEDFDYESFKHKIGLVFDAEMSIDPDADLYLITWAPNPAELPNLPFEKQHLYNYNLLVEYCNSCDVSIFCVESTQMGNPHYHGFYQPSQDHLKEQSRIACVKTMQRFGLVKITKSKGQYKLLNYWTPHANCLYYYKKDLLESMFHIQHNPIVAGERIQIDKYEYMLYLKRDGERITSTELEERFTLRDYYRNFYMNK